ncbi:hypothetical protein Bbelb_159570 [Branchiostoma belcheri]|nr:hypothetical protein Bbelb_159570 [Branchiostoma belcheri]
MSVVAGPSNGEDTHAPDDSQDETENSHGSTQTDEYGDGFIEPYLTAYHLGNLDAEHPGEIASSQQEPGFHNASLLKDTPRRSSYDEDDILEDKESTHTRVDRNDSEDPTDHYYTYIGDHDYTYIDNTSSVVGTEGSAASRSRYSSQETETAINTSQQEEQRDTPRWSSYDESYYTCIGDHDYTYIDNTSSVVSTEGSAASRSRYSSQETETAINTSQQEEQRVVGLLLVTGVITPELTEFPNSGSENNMPITTEQAKSSEDIRNRQSTISFGVDGHPRTVTVSTSGNIAVAFAGHGICIYDSDGVILLDFMTVVEKGNGSMTRIDPHDVSLGTITNDDVWIVGSDGDVSHYVASYDCCGRFKSSFNISYTQIYRRLALNKIQTLVSVTETVRHLGAVNVFSLNGTLEQSLGRQQGLMYPTGVAFDRNSSILVVDSTTAYVYVYQDSGRFLFKFGGKGSNNGQLSLPLGICTDSSRHIIVADSGNRRIELFTSRGEFIRHIATDIDPLSIADGPDGELALNKVYDQKVTILTNY